MTTCVLPGSSDTETNASECVDAYITGDHQALSFPLSLWIGRLADHAHSLMVAFAKYNSLALPDIIGWSVQDSTREQSLGPPPLQDPPGTWASNASMSVKMRVRTA